MSRRTKQTRIMAKLETSYGIDSGPTDALNAILIYEPSHEFIYDSKKREALRQFMGAQQTLHNSRFVQISGKVEAAPSGAPGTAPPWGVLMRGCGMAETITAAVSVQYTPVTDGHESLTIYYVRDRALRKAVGCMGDWDGTWTDGEIPLFGYQFWGIDAGPVEIAPASQVLTAWKTPQMVSGLASGGLKFGSAYSAGAISGGTEMPSRGLTMKLGNDVKQRRVISKLTPNGQSVEIMGRDSTASVQLELTAAQEIALLEEINGGVLTSMSFEHGVGAGQKMAIFCPSGQRLSPKDTDHDGVAHTSIDLSLLPSSGNDELRLVLT